MSSVDGVKKNNPCTNKILNLNKVINWIKEQCSDSKKYKINNPTQAPLKSNSTNSIILLVLRNCAKIPHINRINRQANRKMLHSI